jgi:hypothetical protein
MAFSDNMSAADLAAITGNNNNGWGGDASWIIILFLFMFMGWGGSGLCNGAGNGAGNYGGLYPWMNQSDQINSGFRDQMINDNITEIRNGVNGIQTQLCNGFAGVEQGANTRQMANMQQSFANQTAMLQGFNSMQSQLADCCCENRLASCQTQNIIQNEGNATRFSDANNTRDIIDSQTRGTQAILDKLCQLELDGVKAQVDAKNDRIAELTTQLNMATLRESQTAQNAFISQGFANEVDQLYNRLSNCPVPTTPVYGRTPIFTCNQQVNPCGCGCGM